jgi:carrier protein
LAKLIPHLCNHSGVFASAKEIYHESGIAGFFQGVTPRIIGELLALVLASSASFTVSTYILGDPRYRATLKTTFGVKTKQG